MSDAEDRIISAEANPGDGRDKALRPLSFDEFVGQPSAIANLKVFTQAAARRGEALDQGLRRRRSHMRGFEQYALCGRVALIRLGQGFNDVFCAADQRRPFAYQPIAADGSGIHWMPWRGHDFPVLIERQTGRCQRP